MQSGSTLVLDTRGRRFKSSSPEGNNMNKEELIEFLKENLSIQTQDYSDMYEDGVTIKLLLEGQVISEDNVTFDSHPDI